MANRSGIAFLPVLIAGIIVFFGIEAVREGYVQLNFPKSKTSVSIPDQAETLPTIEPSI